MIENQIKLSSQAELGAGTFQVFSTFEALNALEGQELRAESATIDLCEIPDLVERKTHLVYNFEVSHTHTYIADGIRVHNTSALSFYDSSNGHIVDVGYDAEGNINYYKSVSDDGNGFWEVRTQAVGSNGTTKVEKSYSWESSNGRYNYSHVEFHENGTLVSVEDVEYHLIGDDYAEPVAGILTPYLLQVAGLDTIFERLVAGTLTQTVLENVLEIGLNGLHASTIDGTENYNFWGKVADKSLADFGEELTENFLEMGVSIVSGLILAELYEAIELDGIPGAILEGFLSQGVNYVVNNGLDLLIDELGIFPELDFSIEFASPIHIVTNAILGEVLPSPETWQGALAEDLTQFIVSQSGIFGSIPGAVSAASFMPFMVAVIGPAIVAAVVAQLIDEIFDKDPEAWAGLEFDPISNSWGVDYLRSDDGGSIELAENLGVTVTSMLNSMTDALGSTSNNFNEILVKEIGHYEKSTRNGDSREYAMGDNAVIYSAVVNVLKEFEVLDGDLKVQRAILSDSFLAELENMSASEAFAAIQTRLKFATDYQTYLENTEEINRILTEASGTPLAMAWAMTLLQVSDLGLGESYQATGDAGDNFFATGDGSDTISGGEGADSIFAYGGLDVLQGGSGNDVLDGGFGADTIDGGDGSDRVVFEATNLGIELDLEQGIGISGNAEGDTYVSIENVTGTKQSDVILGSAADNDLSGGDGDDVLSGRQGADTLVGGAGNDTLQGGEGSDSLVGGDGIDIATFRDSTVAVSVQLNDDRTGDSAGDIYESIEGVEGSQFDDVIAGSKEDDILSGYLGDDTLKGGEGDDTYVFDVNQGDDRVFEHHGNNDRLVFADGITLANLRAVVTDTDGNGLKDLTISFDHGSGSITLEQLFLTQYYAHDRQIDWFEFADGTVLSHEAFMAAVYHSGTDADDILEGTANDDTFSSSAGNDIMRGSHGDDTYHVKNDQGHDRIFETNGDDDRIVFAQGITLSDLRASVTDIDDNGQKDLTLTFVNGTGSITLEEQFVTQYYAQNRQVNWFEFADGTVMSHAEFFTAVYHNGTDGNDVLEGTANDDVFASTAGDDVLRGSHGDDIYYVDKDQGHDRIFETNGDDDRIVFAQGITLSDLRASVTDIDENGQKDLTLTFVNGTGSITLEEQFVTQYYAQNRQVNWFEFADGTVMSHAEFFAAVYHNGTDGNDVLEGTANDDVFVSTAGDDVLRGSHGDDVYYIEKDQGHDRILETNGDNDRIVFAQGITLADLIASVADSDSDGHDDVTISFSNGTGSVTLEQVMSAQHWAAQRQIEWFEFADRTILHKNDLFEILGASNGAATAIHTTSGFNSTVVGSVSRDVILSNDLEVELDGAENGDLYLLNAGTAQVHDSGSSGEDVVQFGADFRLSHAYASRFDLDGNGIDDLRIGFAGSTAMFTVLNAFPGATAGGGDTIEVFRFSTGQEFTVEDFFLATSNFIGGDELDNSLAGNDEGNTLAGRDGNDTMSGGDGSDLYIFEAGDGQDVIDDNGNEDTDVLKVLGYDATDASVEWSSDLTSDSFRLVLGTAGDQVTVVNTLAGDRFDEIEEVHFEDGVVWSTRDLRQMVIDARTTAADDALEGWAGDDAFSASEGNDTLQGLGGNDTYRIEVGRGEDQLLEDAGDDTLIFGDGITLADLNVTTANYTSGSAVDLRIAFTGSSGAVTIDGTHETNWSVADGRIIESFRFSDGSHYSWLEFLDATVNAGTSVSEKIYGTYDDNRFAASLGNDTLQGQGGNDAYHIELGHGNDQILEGGGEDTVVFGEGISLSDIQVTTANYAGSNSIDLKVAFSNGVGSFVLDGTHDSNWAVAGGRIVEDFRFEDGSHYSWREFLDRTVNAGTDQGELIYGTYGDNVFASSNGDDTLQGQGGDDIYHIEKGQGDDQIVENEGHDTLSFGPGIKISDLVVTTGDFVGASLTDLKISFRIAEGSITLDGTHASSWSVADGRVMESVSFENGSIYTWLEFLDATVNAGTFENDHIFGTFEDNVFAASHGDDTLRGQRGDDTYHIDKHISSSRIYDIEGTDRIVFGDGVSVKDLRIDSRDIDENGQADTIFTFRNGTGSVAIMDISGSDWDANGAIEEFEFYDGTVVGREFFNLGSASDDVMSSIVPNGFFYGLSGNDIFISSSGWDIIDGGSGTDEVDYSLSSGAVVVELAEGIGAGGDAEGDVISSIENVIGSAFADSIFADGSDNWLAGGSGDDTLDGRSGNDVLYGGLGTDAIFGAWGSDILIGGAGADQLNGGEGSDTVSYEESSESVTVNLLTGMTSGGDALGDVFVSVENLFGSQFSDSLTGDAFANSLTGFAGSDQLFGAEGADSLSGGLGNDVLIGGIGADQLDGGEGIDTATYVESGIGVAIDLSSNFASGGDATGDTFMSIENLIGSHLSDNLTGDNFYNDLKGSEGYDTLSGGGGNDTLDGGIGADTLTGGLGDDLLLGGAGNDFYRYSLGDGFDVLIDESNDIGDILSLVDIASTNVQLETVAEDEMSLVLKAGGVFGSIFLDSVLFTDASAGVDLIQFADGVTWDRSWLANWAAANAEVATDDNIVGTSGSDTLDGGRGNDTLNGSVGADVYLYDYGDGHDLIQDFDTNSNNRDELQFTDLLVEEVTLSQSSGKDLIVTMLDGGSITVVDHFDSQYEDLELMSFADGTVLDFAGIVSKYVSDSATDGNDSIAGSFTSDTLYGGLGNDTLNGMRGADIYQYALGEGNDLIQDYDTSSNSKDELQLSGLVAGDVTFSQNSGKDLVVTMSDGNTVTVLDHFDNSYEDLELISFADGMVLDYAGITSKMVADSATDGNDNIVGSFSSDTLYGSLGNDTLDGGRGGDTYLYAFGDGDDLIEDYDTSSNKKDELRFTDLLVEDVTFSQNSSNDLVITMSDGGTVTVFDHFASSYFDLELMSFADGTELNYSQITAKFVSDSATNGNDNILGSFTSDTLYGGLGNDTLDGGRGGDTYLYAFGDGDDLIQDYDTSSNKKDELRFTDLLAEDVTLSQNSSNDLVITMSDGGTVTVFDHFVSSYYDLELMSFANGAVLNYSQITEKLVADSATIGNDNIMGSFTSDTLYGGLGNDTLNGGRGGDTYLYAFGDGDDLIQDYDTSSAKLDVLVFSDLTASEVSLQQDDGQNLIINVNGGGSVTIEDHFANGYEDLERIEFSDGTIWSLSDINDNWVWV